MSSARRVSGALALVLALATAAPARAQVAPASPGRPQVTWLVLGRGGDTRNGAADRSMQELALEPLRLSLLGRHAVMPADECAGLSSGGKSSYGGLRAMRTVAVNLLDGPSWRSPRLTLFGFSRLGCPLDAAVGGGAALTVPIRPSVSFVLSGGAIYLPATKPGVDNPTGGPAKSVRADVVFRRPEGRSFNLGVDTLLRGVSFGGVF